jgi:membrane protein implicated in regulation of membrane protease activity
MIYPEDGGYAHPHRMVARNGRGADLPHTPAGSIIAASSPLRGNLKTTDVTQMSWWSWMIGGAVLLGAELGFVNAQFYLVFIGGAALLVGLVSVAAPHLASWAQWALFAIVALVSMVLFRSRLYRRLRGQLPAVAAGPARGLLTLPNALDPGQSCQVEHGGTYWTVRNDGSVPLPPGCRARITSVQGLTLLVRPDV